MFIEVFEGGGQPGSRTFSKWLVQGTLYPDVIESVSFKGPSVRHQIHHNVGGLPEKINMKLIEPLRELFEDEVRASGESSVCRRPSSGGILSGTWAGRALPRGHHREKLDVLRRGGRHRDRRISAPRAGTTIWQAFAVLLPVKTVGVMGDGRTYEHVLALRAVSSTDGMTADSIPTT